MAISESFIKLLHVFQSTWVCNLR